jgi:DNA polymerase III delta subunit
MNIKDLNLQIRKGELDHFYIFYGDEIGLQNLYIQQLSKGKVAQRVDDFASIMKKVTTKNTVFGKADDDRVYIIRDDSTFMKTEKAWDIEIKSGIVILLVTTLDKRSKFYKHFKDKAIEFKPAPTGQCIKLLKGHITGAIGDLEYFIESCNNDYNTIFSNLDKIKRLGYKEVTRQLIDDLIVKADNGNVFDLATFVIRQDSVGAITELNKILGAGENAIGILSVLYNRLKECILVEGYRGEYNIAKSTGLNPWVCKSILADNNIQPAALLHGLRIVDKYDRGIKMGIYEPQAAATGCVIELLDL